MDFNFTEEMNEVVQKEDVQTEQRVETVKEAAKSKKKNEEIVAEIAKAVGSEEDEAKAAKLAEKRAKREAALNEDMDSSLAKFKPFIDKDPGFEYHFFNDKPGEIQKRETLGWELVFSEEMAAVSGQTDRKSPIQIPTGFTDPQLGVTAYLMKIERELFEEGKALKEKINKEKMDSIHNLSNDRLDDSIKIENN